MNKSRKYITKRVKNKRNKKTRKNIKGGFWKFFRSKKPDPKPEPDPEPDPEFIFDSDNPEKNFRESKTYEKDVYILNILGMSCINTADNKRRIRRDGHFNKMYYEKLCISSDDSKYTSATNRFMNSLLPSILRDQIVYNAATLKVGLKMLLLQKQHIIDELKNVLNTYKYLVIFGFSQGGAVANAIAESINDSRELDLERVFIKTFGSIYISNNAKNVNIENYLIPGDLSEEFNGKRLIQSSEQPTDFKYNNEDPYFQKLKTLSPTTNFISMDKDNSIIWIDNEYARNRRKNPNGKDKIPQFGLNTFGSQLGFEIHSSYWIINDFITNVIDLLYMELKFTPEKVVK